MAAGDNKRQHERFPVSRPVETTTADGTQGGELTDISAGGAAIQATGAFAIALGAPVELRVENFEKLPGHVVRAAAGNSFAIAFDMASDEAGDTIRAIIGAGGKTEG